MKAIIWTAYGEPNVLQLQNVEKPSPKPGEVLIKIHATTVETGDCELRRFKLHNKLYLPFRLFFGITKPRIKILGQQFAGEVEAVGKTVKKFKVGDQLFGAIDMGFGTYAEYICLPEKTVMTNKPSNVTWEELAPLSVGGLNALHFLKKGNVQKGTKLLIHGTSGSIGTYAVQLAKLLGAEVTAICSTSKIELVKSLDADRVIDYTKDDIAACGETFDVIFDTIGKSDYSTCLKLLQPHGCYLLANPTVAEQLRGLWTSMTSSKKVMFELAKYNLEDLNYLKGLIEEKKITTVIDQCFPLEKIADAHRYVEEGHKRGNVVVTVKSR